MNILIAATGRAGSGKDTFAKPLLGAGFKRAAFADALKEITAFIANEPVEWFHDYELKELQSPALGMTRRAALQKVGSAMRNLFGEDVWCNRVMSDWVACGKPDTVITDCRYDNEARAVLDAGGTVVSLVRPGEKLLSGESAAHESENGVNDAFVTIEVTNNGSIGDLHHEARKILNALRGAEDV